MGGLQEETGCFTRGGSDAWNQGHGSKLVTSVLSKFLSQQAAAYSVSNSLHLCCMGTEDSSPGAGDATGKREGCDEAYLCS